MVVMRGPWVWLLVGALCAVGASGSALGADVSGSAGARRVLDPVAWVNGVPIERAAYQERVDRFKAQFERRRSGLPERYIKRQATRQLKIMIEEELLRQHCDQAQVFLTPQEELEAWDAHMGRYGRDAERKLKRLLATSGYTEAQYRLKVVFDARVAACMDQMGLLKITESELHRHYKHASKRYRVPPKVSAAQLIIRSAHRKGMSNKEAVREVIDELWKKATAPGADFGALVRAHSQGPRAGNGGAMGWLPLAAAPKWMRKTLSSLAPGEVSEPFKSPKGWMIVKVFARQAGRVKPYAEARPDILERVRNRRISAARRKLVATLRRRSTIKTVERFNP